MQKLLDALESKVIRLKEERDNQTFFQQAYDITDAKLEEFKNTEAELEKTIIRCEELDHMKNFDENKNLRVHSRLQLKTILKL